MNILFYILYTIAGIISLLLIIPLFMRRKHFVKREIIINASSQKIFDYVKLIKNQETFNKHAAADADRDNSFSGVDGTVGFLYSWRGNKKAGEGEKEIMKIVEGKLVEMEIRFTKPMKTAATVTMETEALSSDKTKVTWSNAGELKYPFNIFIPMLEKNLPRDMDASLVNLKNILEK